MIKDITKLIFEAIHLKRIKHEWIRLAWVENPDSVAEHSLIAAQIAYLLAKAEWANAHKCATMLVWHDIAETRIGDLHKIATRYIKNKNAIEEEIMDEQFSWFDFKDEILDEFKQYEDWTSLEWVVAKDADLLEQAFQCREYVEKWYNKAQNWIDNIWKVLQTKTAKLIFKEINNTSFTSWWEEDKLKNLTN